MDQCLGNIYKWLGIDIVQLVLHDEIWEVRWRLFNTYYTPENKRWLDDVTETEDGQTKVGKDTRLWK